MNRTTIMLSAILALFVFGLLKSEQSKLFPSIAWSPDQITVAVFNGNGGRGMAGRTKTYLQEYGFQVSAIGNADTFEYKATVVIVLSEEAKVQVLLQDLPATAEIVTPEEFNPHYDALAVFIPPGTDAVLIVGAGWPL